MPGPSFSGVPKVIRKLHKYLSLGLLAVWLLQAVTGVSNVFYRELDAALLNGNTVPLDEAVLAQKIDKLRVARLPERLSSVYASGGDPTQFDVFVHTLDDGLHVLRVDGQGTVLREQPWGVNFARSGLLLSMRLIHESMFLGDNALIFIGLSGLLLLTNLTLGLAQAWPAARQWRAALTARAPERIDLRIRALHRALGLWIGVPVLIVIAAGVGVAFTDSIESVLDDPAHLPERPDTVPGAAAPEQVPLADALAAARRVYPDARLSIVTMPHDSDTYFAIYLLQESELRRVFGKTIVYVDALNGEILAAFDAADRPVTNRIVDAFYAVHTGEAGGLAGRMAVLFSGLGLLALAGLGLALWLNRRRQLGIRARTRPAERKPV